MTNYSSSIPENQKNEYEPYDTVDFMVTFQGQSLQLGSVKLEGTVDVTHNGLFLDRPANQNLDIKYDPMVGAHAVVESVQTEMLGEVFESLNEYPRMVKQSAVARNSKQDMFNSSNVAEMRCPHSIVSNGILKGSGVRNQLTTRLRDPPDFSIKLDNILNSSTDLLPYDRTGPIRVSLNLSRVESFLYGEDVDENTSYSLSNLRLCYYTVDGMENRAPIELRRKLNIKQSLQSNLSNVATKVPSNSVEAMTASFQIQQNENSYKNNNLILEKVPSLSELTFLFNDQSNAVVSFVIKSNVEVLERYVEALGETKRNDLAVCNMNNNEGYGIGLRMDPGPVDLSNQKFSVQLNSGISSNKPLIMYMYFHSVLSI